jgi:hypothetical protein
MADTRAMKPLNLSFFVIVAAMFILGVIGVFVVKLIFN